MGRFNKKIKKAPISESFRFKGYRAHEGGFKDNNFMKKSILLLMFTTLMSWTYAQKNSVTANPDSTYRGMAVNVLKNDTDKEGDKLKITSYKIDGISYAPRLSARAIPGKGNVIVRDTGYILVDSTMTITYTCSDSKYGTSTTTLSVRKRPTIVNRPRMIDSLITVVSVPCLLTITLLNSTHEGCIPVPGGLHWVKLEGHNWETQGYAKALDGGLYCIMCEVWLPDKMQFIKKDIYDWIIKSTCAQ